MRIYWRYMILQLYVESGTITSHTGYKYLK